MDLIENYALLEKAWECIETQFLNYAKSTSSVEGPGLSIFKMIDKTRIGYNNEPYNCEYYYALKDDDVWKKSFSLFKVESSVFLNNISMFAICVQVTPQNQEQPLGSIRFYSFDTSERLLSLEIKDSTEESVLHRRFDSTII